MNPATLKKCRLVERNLSPMADRRAAMAALRDLGSSYLTEALWFLPQRELPVLSALLPAMASPDIQRRYTGNCGRTLLEQTLPFVELLRSRYRAIRGTELAGRRILDFGCGYGRFARALYCVTDEDRLVGCDPSEEAIGLCHAAGLSRSQFRVSDHLPESLPADCDFELIVAYSVFTHLSARAARTCLRALRKHVSPAGLLALTIRPVEYWSAAPRFAPESTLRLREEHARNGFAFVAHQRAPVDGDVTYGDCSMSVEWLANAAPGWQVVATSPATGDPLQHCVVLQATHSP